MSGTRHTPEIPDDIMRTAKACYETSEFLDSGEIVETIAKYIFDERNRSAALSRPIDNAGEALLTEAERRSGVIRSEGDEGEDKWISVNQWKDEPDRVTFGVFLGNHRWIEVDFLPTDAAKVAALIQAKPAVKDLSSSPVPKTAMVEVVETLCKVISDCLKECDRSARPSYAWQLRAKDALAAAKAEMSP